MTETVLPQVYEYPTLDAHTRSQSVAYHGRGAAASVADLGSREVSVLLC